MHPHNLRLPHCSNEESQGLKWETQSLLVHPHNLRLPHCSNEGSQGLKWETKHNLYLCIHTISGCPIAAMRGVRVSSEKHNLYLLCIHTISGTGFPSARHVKYTVLPNVTSTSLGSIVMVGFSVRWKLEGSIIFILTDQSRKVHAVTLLNDGV